MKRGALDNSTSGAATLAAAWRFGSSATSTATTSATPRPSTTARRARASSAALTKGGALDSSRSGAATLAAVWRFAAEDSATSSTPAVAASSALETSDAAEPAAVTPDSARASAHAAAPATLAASEFSGPDCAGGIEAISSTGNINQINIALLVIGLALLMAGGLVIGGGGGETHLTAAQKLCQVCFDTGMFRLACCGKYSCNFCLKNFVLTEHKCQRRPGDDVWILPLTDPRSWQLGTGITSQDCYEHCVKFPPWYFAEGVRKNGKAHLFYYDLHQLEQGRDPEVTEVIHIYHDKDKLGAPVHTCVYNKKRSFSEL
ncbi:hypothetical protein ACP4OV_022984 [Aristida adscensionis]